MSTNLARFLIGSSPSADRGFDAAATSVTLQLEASSGLIRSTTFAVYDAADPASPLASASAPVLTLNNGVGSTGRKVNAATPTSAVTLSGLVLASGHAHLVRCLVNDGLDSAGRPSAQHVFERLISCRSNGRRRLVPGESTQGSARGWADEIWVPDPAIDLVVPTVSPLVTTTNATPVNIDLNVLNPDQDALNIVGVRVIGETTTEGSKLFRDFSVALSGVANWLKAGGAGANGPYSDSGIFYHNGFGHDLATANIVCNSVSGGLLRVTVTGVAGLTINWRAYAWKVAL